MMRLLFSPRSAAQALVSIAKQWQLWHPLTASTRARKVPPPRGAIAQLGERLHGMQEVGGSIPPSSTTSRKLIANMQENYLDLTKNELQQSILRPKALASIRHWSSHQAAGHFDRIHHPNIWGFTEVGLEILACDTH